MYPVAIHKVTTAFDRNLRPLNPQRMHGCVCTSYGLYNGRVAGVAEHPSMERQSVAARGTGARDSVIVRDVLYLLIESSPDEHEQNSRDEKLNRCREQLEVIRVVALYPDRDLSVP